MFDQISRFLLGSYGEMGLNLYLEHQLLFNSIIIVCVVIAMVIRRVKHKHHKHDERNH